MIRIKRVSFALFKLSISETTLVNRCISKGTRFFRYRYPLIGTRSVLVPVWSHWNALRYAFRSVTLTLQKFNEQAKKVYITLSKEIVQ